MTWYIQNNAETVTIYDRLDANGNGNIRFKGTHECALTHLAGLMQEVDEMRARIKELEHERDVLKRRLEEAGR